MELLRERMRHCRLIALPTVIEEIQWLADNDSASDVREYANHAIDHMVKDWRILPLDCAPVHHGIVEVAAQKLRDKDLIPYDERHDACLLAHAAHSGAAILLTTDEHLLSVDYKKVKAVFDLCDMECPLIQSPAMLVRKFGSKKR